MSQAATIEDLVIKEVECCEKAQHTIDALKEETRNISRKYEQCVEELRKNGREKPKTQEF